MTFEDLKKANETIATTDIKGKEYAEVNQRIKAFRMVYPNGTIETNIISLDNGIVVMKAFIKDEEGKLIGTGYAYEKEGSSFINKTSYIENCETSAVGRALGMCGFGIDVSVASYEEVANAIENQQKLSSNQVSAKKQVNTKVEDKIDYRQKTVETLRAMGLDLNAFAQKYKLNSKSSNEDFKNALEDLENGTRS